MRIDVVDELETFWVALGMAISLSLLLGIALLASMLQVASLKEMSEELVKQNERLFQLQKDLSKELRGHKSALRAECEHVEQLKRKTRLMALLLEELQARLEH